ncbi:FAD-dependent oxidoreductase [Streptomyces somaliensis DSM 40738]|uniref:FAD-dependent oxidoreductase n=1 Tax=Streptomyces somaliensis (strain ATCC 33201 / DSM 40738 / JCM 12659 / KCTC 9044 / NCTC 11332 / NRRL B-12077 / IP 733) TaxID=1134445 RepID=A0AA44DC65_STRE0|nr:FAD-dependent oxidoreductase [Streptomyces somaliensis]MCQ0022795.1 FAD-dependent oxidoreductase [Streptomyces somaliensis DSM 40738]NKY14176.1 FAD-dependent oxidoreductase [Streptomyces somaliensis DSM 40738]
MRIVVVGAGYAGTIAANRLARKVRAAEITVVNPRPDFVERVRLHEWIAGTGAATAPLASMLSEGIATRVGTVDGIGDGRVALGDGTGLDFDHLFLAVGSTAAPLPGTVEVGTWEGAEEARAALAGLPAGRAVTVVGGGLTGIETASEIAFGRPDLRVRLVGRTIAAGLSEGARERVRTGLDRLGVEVVEDAVTRVDPGTRAGDGDAVRLRSRSPAASDLTLWAVVGGVPDLAARSGLEVDAEGRAVVDQYLRSVSDPRIFAVGDCAAVPGSRAACATAMPQGAHAADTLARMVRGREPAPYSMGYAGQALSLGRRDGLLQVDRRDGTAARLHVAGRTAAVVKERICRYARSSARTAVYTWLRGAE